MRRFIVLLFIALLAAPGTWVRHRLPPYVPELALTFDPVAVPQTPTLARSLGPFALHGIWHLRSRRTFFGGFSALGWLGDGTLLAISDQGYVLRFAAPGEPPAKPWFQRLLNNGALAKRANDAESLTVDPPSGTFWVGWEDSNAITRHATGLTQEAWLRPDAMADWGGNIGPETLVRLRNGRFLVIREGSDGVLNNTRHRALLYAGDPTISQQHIAFTFVGTPGFRPVDAAQLPDGRVLVLMRKLVWPFPARFAGRIVLLDPGLIRKDGDWSGPIVARLTSSLPVDNFEGMAVEPQADGTSIVWLISDDNRAALQRTLLWKLALDPAKLPPREIARKAPPARRTADRKS